MRGRHDVSVPAFQPVVAADVHRETGGEDEAAEDLDEPGVVRVDAGGAALDDLREEPAEGQQDAADELRDGRRQEVRTRGGGGARTAFMKTFSGRVLCL